VADPADSTTSATPSDPPSEPATSDTASPLPSWAACSDVWVKDAKLPRQYRGCLEGDTAVAADSLGCSSGQRIVRYDDQFFGVAGGTIYHVQGPLNKNTQYLKMIRVCRA
jgi:hypothetical protein